MVGLGGEMLAVPGGSKCFFWLSQGDLKALWPVTCPRGFKVPCPGGLAANAKASHGGLS